MPRDKSADQRLELARQITFKEQRYEDLAKEKSSIQAQLGNFQNQMDHLFQKEQQLYEEVQQNGIPMTWEQSAYQEVRRTIQRVTVNQEELLEQDYRKERNQIENEIENLHRERNALPWD